MEAISVALVIDVTFPCSAAVMAFTGGDGTKDCTLCISTEAMEGNAVGPGRALIDFLSQAAERCVQL